MTKRIKIVWLHDYAECETCGGGYAEGARVYLDGELLVEMEPVAHCYGGTHYTQEDVYRRILEMTGHTVEEVEHD